MAGISNVGNIPNRMETITSNAAGEKENINDQILLDFSSESCQKNEDAKDDSVILNFLAQETEVQNSDNNVIEKNKKLPKKEVQIFNENGSINPDKLGQMMESGILSVDGFISACGYDLRNEEDLLEIGFTRSCTFNFTLPDGTEASGLTSDWLGMSNPYVHLTTPDGTEYNFEYVKLNPKDSY